jgi:hypothetical protein
MALKLLINYILWSVRLEFRNSWTVVAGQRLISETTFPAETNTVLYGKWLVYGSNAYATVAWTVEAGDFCAVLPYLRKQEKLKIGKIEEVQ